MTTTTREEVMDDEAGRRATALGDLRWREIWSRCTRSSQPVVIAWSPGPVGQANRVPW